MPHRRVKFERNKKGTANDTFTVDPLGDHVTVPINIIMLDDAALDRAVRMANTKLFSTFSPQNRMRNIIGEYINHIANSPRGV